MARNLVNGNKRSKGYFFTTTATADARGYLLKNDDRPPELTFRDLLENTPFFQEESDQAQLDDVSGELYLKAGLSVLATDAQAKANTAKPSSRSLVVQPSQLPTSVTAGNQDINTADTPLTGAALVDVTVDGAVTTRNENKVGLSAALIAWLVAKFDGIRTDVDQNASDIDGLATVTIPALDTRVGNLETTIATLDALPVGAEIDWPSDTPPAGGKWFIEDGSTHANATYPGLYAVIGSVYGTGGAGTFKLPDPRGKVKVYKLSGDPDFGNFADTGGAKTYTILTGDLPPHTHEAASNGATLNITASGSHAHYRDYDDAVGTSGAEVRQGSGSDGAFAGSAETHTHVNGDFAGVVGNGPGSSDAFSILNPFYVGSNKIIKVLP